MFTAGKIEWVKVELVECIWNVFNNQSDKNVYVSSVTLNGEKLDGCYITHSQLMNGGELVFEMSKAPATE